MRESKFLIFTRYNNNNNNNVIGRAYTLFFWYIGNVCDLEKVIQLQESCVNNTREFLTREWEKKFDSLAVLKLFLSSFLPRFSIVEESRYPWSGGALSSAILLLFFTLALTRAHVFLTLANRIRAKIRERVRKRRVSDVYIIPDDSLHDDIIRASMERIIENRSNNYPIEEQRELEEERHTEDSIIDSNKNFFSKSLILIPRKRDFPLHILYSFTVSQEEEEKEEEEERRKRNRNRHFTEMRRCTNKAEIRGACYLFSQGGVRRGSFYIIAETRFQVWLPLESADFGRFDLVFLGCKRNDRAERERERETADFHTTT